MRGWQTLKQYFNALWRSELARELLRSEDSNGSHLIGERSRTSADWERIRAATGENEFAKRREQARQFDAIAEAQRRSEQLNAWKNKTGTASDPDTDLKGKLAPSPGSKSYSGDARRDAPPSDVAKWILSGQFKTVSDSSNVYAIAYDARTSSLFVQYKHWAPPMKFGTESGPGPVYEYKNVSIAEASALYRANSASEWLWDHVRQRGTWAGHRKPYRLIAISGGYLPRKATWASDGREWFIRRYMTSAGGANIRSQLPDAPAPPMGFDGKPDWSNYKPYRGTPNRGKPNRGDSPNVPY